MLGSGSGLLRHSLAWLTVFSDIDVIGHFLADGRWAPISLLSPLCIAWLKSFLPAATHTESQLERWTVAVWGIYTESSVNVFMRPPPPPPLPEDQPGFH